MTLINNLGIKHKAQAVVEYIVMFTLLMICIILVFGGVSTNRDQNVLAKYPGVKTPAIKSVFDKAVTNAINEIKR